MNRKLDIDSWNRKEHFLFFKQMQEPFFGITATIDCTKAYQKSKELNVSFFTYYLHKTLEALNAIEPFRYRICNDEIIIFDRIDASATILREDTSFGFSLIEYNPDLLQFAKNAKKEIERVQNTTGLFTREFPENLIHFSSFPWVSFTSLSHARSFTFPDSCPKITFGKMTIENHKRTVPVSVHVHHALMDGYHASAFFTLFQEKMNA
jgi:chloramphenicol O-acetyltransferase type A